MSNRRSSQHPEILALRLILAQLADTPDEAAYYSWLVLADSNCTRDSFDVAVRTAREAARWWRSIGNVEHARELVGARLQQFMDGQHQRQPVRTR